MTKPKLQLAVLISGAGTTLENILQHIENKTLDAEVAVVISSKPGVAGLDIARRCKIPNYTVDRRTIFAANQKTGPWGDHFNGRIHQIFDQYQTDLVVLAGFAGRLEIRDYAERVMNIHPALIPAFSGGGYYGDRVYRAVLESGVKLTGVTVHFCDDNYDTGPIILQETVPVYSTDDIESLKQRVQKKERELYPRAIQLFADGRLKIEGNRVLCVDQEL